MRKCDIKVLSDFLARTGMYIGACTRESIISFVHGYEAGAQGECNFTKLTSQRLEKRCRTRHLVRGWPDQTERCIEKRDLDWLQGLAFIASEVLKGANVEL